MAEGTRVFVPKNFEKTEAFEKQVEEYLFRTAADYLWIQNPQDVYTFWNCASVYKSGFVSIGGYRIMLCANPEEEDGKLVFQGGFSYKGTVFECSEVILDQNGTLSFQFSSNGDIMKQLGAGLRYLMPLEDGDRRPVKRGFMGELYNSVLKIPSGTKLVASISPCELFDDKQTYISLPEGIEIKSNFFTPDGERQRLISNSAKLVFERTAHAQSVDGDMVSLYGMDFYLGIQGDFTCALSEIVPGLSAGEKLSLNGSLRFIPGQDALLSGKTSGQKATTAWVQIQGSYYSSPSESSLYTVDDSVFRPVMSKVAEFSGYSECFPLFPWFYASWDTQKKNEKVQAQKKQKREQERAEKFLYGKRYQCLVQQTLQASGKEEESEEITAATPNGICIGMDAGTGRWNWIGLGNVSGGRQPDICLSGELGNARVKLLNQDCFICAQSMDEFSNYGGGAELAFETAGWKVSLPEDDWKSKGVIVIIKYSRSFSIMEKMEGNQTLAELMEYATRSGQEASGWDGFLKAVKERDFEGLLLLNANAKGVSLSSEEEQAVEGADMRALYVAVRNGKIAEQDGQAYMGTTPVSAFLHYEADFVSASEKGCYKTIGVSVQIEASKVVSFKSRSQLYLPTLLGEQAECCLFLDGSLQQGEGGNCFRFSLESEVDCGIVHSAAESISIQGVCMVLSGNGKSFLLDGRISFVKEDECDIFSYSCLAFENLCIWKDDDGKLSEDISGLKFSIEDTKARENSFADIFGASVQEYYTGGTDTPDSLGYCSINTPVEQGEMEQAWNGIRFHVGIGQDGSMGNGSIVGVDLIFAWAGRAYYFGVKESDLNGFSLSGVLGFGFGGLELVKGSQTGKLMLKFCSVGIKILKYTVPRESADLYVFGEQGKLGWYMGYKGEQDGLCGINTI